MAGTGPNLLKNPDFSKGRARPSGWTWTTVSGDPDWSFVPGRNEAKARAVRIRADEGGASGGFAQTVRVKGDRHYRIEATLRADCTRTASTGGAALDLVVRGRDAVVDTSPGCGCAARQRAWTVWRRYYHTPTKATHMEVRVALRGAVGEATIESVRVVPIEAPETRSHALAVPPPPVAERPPRQVRSVRIGDDSGAAARLADVINLRLGPNAATLQPARAADGQNAKSDAVIFPSFAPAPSRLTLKRLHTLATDAVLLIGLKAFAEIVNTKRGEPILKTRVLKQDAEPPHARIAFANFMTRGFALGDVFPYWWDKRLSGVYTQRHLRNTPALRKFCKTHGYETILANEGDTDATTGHPLCLYHPTEHGGVVVIDAEPIVAHPTSEDESSLAVHLLLNMLGAPQHALGQFVVPPSRLQDLGAELDELGTRFPPVRVRRLSDGEGSTERREVELGGTDDGYFGLPFTAPPAIVIRTGADAWNWDGVYGTLLWIKSLVRPAPFFSRYARALLGARRIAWTPLVQPDRWGRFDADCAAADGAVADVDSGRVAAVIDIVSTPAARTRLVTPEAGGPYAKYEAGLPALTACLLDGRHLYYAAGDAAAPAELNGSGFLPEATGCDVVADLRAFENDFHRGTQGAGAECLRLELPAEAHAQCAHSIRRTDRAALLLEWLVGLQIGLLAVNRDADPVTLRVPVFAPNGGRFDLIDLDGNVQRTDGIPSGNRTPLDLTLDPGATLILQRD